MKVERTNTLGLKIMPTIKIGTNPNARQLETQALDLLDDLMQYTTDIGQDDITKQLHDIYNLMESRMTWRNFVPAETHFAHLKLVR